MAGSKKIPQRKCVGCGLLKDKKTLVRLLADDETKEIIVDLSGRKNGRGCYVCRNDECMEKARRGHGIEHSLKCRVTQENWERLIKEITGQNG